MYTELLYYIEAELNVLVTVLFCFLPSKLLNS